MKYVQTFEGFLFESRFNGQAWHTTFKEIKRFDATPTWFTADPAFAKSYHDNSQNQGGDVHTYEVRITCNILSQDEARGLVEDMGIDFEELTTALTENPTRDERIKLVAPLRDKCDGFFHWDYDPRDWGDGESILVFDPTKHAKIIKEMDYDDDAIGSPKTKKFAAMIGKWDSFTDVAYGKKPLSRDWNNAIRTLGIRDFGDAAVVFYDANRSKKDVINAAKKVGLKHIEVNDRAAGIDGIIFNSKH